jgi:hypothetical protein
MAGEDVVIIAHRMEELRQACQDLYAEAVKRPRRHAMLDLFARVRNQADGVLYCGDEAVKYGGDGERTKWRLDRALVQVMKLHDKLAGDPYVCRDKLTLAAWQEGQFAPWPRPSVA